MRSYWCDINHLLKIMESRCPNTLHYRHLAGFHPHTPPSRSTSGSPFIPAPHPRPQLPPNICHTLLLASEANPVESSKAQCFEGGDLESHAGWRWSRACFYFFFLNFKWIHNSLGSMLSCLTGSHWEAHLIWKSIVNINFFRSFVSPWELEDTIKNIWGRKTMLCWWHASSKQRELILAGEKNEQNTYVLFVKYESKKMS